MVLNVGITTKRVSKGAISPDPIMRVIKIFENLYIRMTETRFYEPARLSTPPAPKFLFSL